VIAENFFMSLFMNYLDLYLSFVFCNLVFRPSYHSAVKFISSEQNSLYMKGQINTGVDQTALF